MNDNIFNLILFIPMGILIWGIFYASSEFYKKYGIVGLIFCIIFTLSWFLNQ